MPCGKPAVVHVVAKPSGTHLAACDAHTSEISLDLGETNSSIVEVPIAAGSDIRCAYVSPHEIDEIL